MTAHNTARKRTYAAYAVMLAFMMLAVYFAARAVIAYISPESLWADYKTPLIAANAPQASASQDIALSFDPFHRERAPAPVDAGKDAPETTLNLKLLGRRAGPDGTAILQTPDNTQNVFSIGDEIISGVVLRSVTPDFIVLSLDGRLERLTFMRDKNSALIAAPSAVLSTADAGANTAAAHEFSAAEFLSSVSVERAMDGARVKGFVITKRNPDYDLSAYGLRSGDIITQIGNTDLTQGQPNFQTMMSAINASQSLSMTLIRDGRTMNIMVK